MNYHHRRKRFCSFFRAGTDNWNDDVLIEILLWLPAKTLIRFVLVCKHWRSLISADQFRRLHTLRHPKPQPSLILDINTPQFLYFHPIYNCEKLIPYSFSIYGRIPKILSSCNGLLLLQPYRSQKYFDVYNPTTKQSRKISLTKSKKYTKVLGLNLAFDPSKSLHYRIVCIRAATMSDSYRECCQIEVYDSESHAWSLCLEPFLVSMDVNFHSGVHWNNVIHWVGRNYGPSLCFDIDKNVIRELPRIPFSNLGNVLLIFHGLHRGFGHLRELNGHLYYLKVIGRPGDKALLVYELQEDYSGWILEYDHGFGRDHDKFQILPLKRQRGGRRTLVTHVPTNTTISFWEKSSARFADQPFYLGIQFGECLVPV